MNHGTMSYMLVMSVTAISCRGPVSKDADPTCVQEQAWTGMPGSLAEWGRTKNGVFAVLDPSDSEEDALLVWQWQRGLLKRTDVFQLPRSVDVTPAADGICGLHMKKTNGQWPYVLLKLSDKRILKEWEFSGLNIAKTSVSDDGNTVALFAENDVSSGNFAESGRVAMVDVKSKELTWISDLEGRGTDTVRQVIMSDDKRYMAVAGWGDGVAMTDVGDKKSLWNKRPGSISYAVFSKDSKSLFAGGTEGCVYSMDVKTGAVLKRRWAAPTNEAIYGHRISALAISADGKWLAAGTGPEGRVYLWNLVTDKRWTVNHGLGSILVLAFSPDSDRLASIGDGVLKVWQLATQAP